MEMAFRHEIFIANLPGMDYSKALYQLAGDLWTFDFVDLVYDWIVLGQHLIIGKLVMELAFQ
jgi:hypothetical protein